MANSLRDQLLGAGVVDKKRAKKARLDKHLKNKQLKKTGKSVVDENKQQIQQQQQQKAIHDRQLNQQKEEKAKQKAISAQIIQLIKMNIIQRKDADRDYRFTDVNSIKSIYVNQLQQQQLATGRLAIALLDNRYELVPLGVAEKIALRDPSKVVIQPRDEKMTDDSDPYAEFEIPDDLMW